VSLHQVSDGLLSAFGDLCDGTLDEAELNGFVTNPSFWDPLQLPTRYSRWLQSEGRDRSDHFSMRAWCLNEPRRDREAEDFAVVPESPQALLADGTLRLNQTTRRGRFSTDALRELPEFGGTEGKIEIAGWYWHGDLRVLAVDEAMQQILALSEGEFANREDWIITHWDDIAGLCEVGLVIWQPKPK
jgi:hypothetical protein